MIEEQRSFRVHIFLSKGEARVSFPSVCTENEATKLELDVLREMVSRVPLQLMERIIQDMHMPADHVYIQNIDGKYLELYEKERCERTN